MATSGFPSPSKSDIAMAIGFVPVAISTRVANVDAVKSPTEATLRKMEIELAS